MPSFPLTDQGWIPVLEPDGTYREVGLREALTRAHELSVGFGAADRLPLLRVLLAALDAACGPRDEAEWDTAWTAPTLDGDRINAYLDEWAHRLDLFHPEHPVFQSAAVAEPNRDVRALREASLGGAAGRWFDREAMLSEHQPPVAPATAVRQLLFLLAYDVAGIKGAWPGDPAEKGGKVFGAKTGPAAVTHIHLASARERLKDILLLNLPPQPRVAGDAPVWERPTPPAAIRTREATGRLDLWTWPLRRIRLHPDEHGQVSGLALHDGDRFAEGAWGAARAHDPMTAWNFGKKGSYPMPFLDVTSHPRPWRAAILLAHTSPASAPATSRVIQHAIGACERGTIDPDTEITAVMAGTIHTNRHQSVISQQPVGISPLGRARMLADPDTRAGLATQAQYAEVTERNLQDWSVQFTRLPADRLGHRAALTDLDRDWETVVRLAANNTDAARSHWRRAIGDVADHKIDALPGGFAVQAKVRAHYLTPPPKTRAYQEPASAAPQEAPAPASAAVSVLETPQSAAAPISEVDFWDAAAPLESEQAAPAALRRGSAGKSGQRSGRPARTYEAFGGRYTLREVSELDQCVVAYQTLYARVRAGWNAEAAATTPPRAPRPD
ncbi:type I-E CRISPR-associated protein Cse1/CasA [Streptomyces xiamenensis]|uniref:type I-E CRISPR-associated protein Cse1/CasA n=1 Tax=Streptomyces xiamenensis TaxID=408015 RepID=UPI0035D589FA